MTDILDLAVPFLAGVVLGVLFLVGLWWTVGKGVVSENPALWFFGSMLLRTILILVGFYVVSEGHWSRLVACLVGFFLARFAVVKRLVRAPAEQEPHHLQQEADNASKPR